MSNTRGDHLDIGLFSPEIGAMIIPDSATSTNCRSTIGTLLAANHVWSYDFVSSRTYDGRTFRVLTLIDEYTRKCLALRVARRLNTMT